MCKTDIEILVLADPLLNSETKEFSIFFKLLRCNVD